MSTNIQPINSNIYRLPIRKSRIAIHQQDVIRFIDLNEIVYLKSEGNYTRFILEDEAMLLSSSTLKKYEDLLNQEGFLRIHQQYIINLRFLNSINKKNGYSVLLNGLYNIPCSRRRRFMLVDYSNQFSL